jgi:hypothetical protein
MSNSNLRRCSHAEQGVWIAVICIMHDQGEYGMLRWPLKEIAQAVGAPLALVRGLVAKGVLKGDDGHLKEPFVYVPRSGRKDGAPVVLIDAQPGPIWYSSRMVRDEYVRTVRGGDTRFGGDEGDAPMVLKKTAPKPPLGDGSSSSSSSSSSASTSIPPIPQRGKSSIETVPVAELVQSGISPAVAEEFIAHKARVRAPLTPRAWQAHLREAERAGWTAQQAAERVLEKGWKGFEAAYVAPATSRGGNRQQALEDSNRSVGEAWAAAINPGDDHAPR